MLRIIHMHINFLTGWLLVIALLAMSCTTFSLEVFVGEKNCQAPTYWLWRRKFMRRC
uniref:Uncharacterized protein n=1 Tax=Arundo donax TaxID=35708 RepID=A0A0A9EIG9_ARUDO